MKKTVLVRYGEIALKSEPVRREFESLLIQNIESMLANSRHKVKTERGRIFIETEEAENVALRTAKVPGVVSTSPTKKCKASIEEIQNLALKVFNKHTPRRGSFAVRARRVGSHRFNSQEIEEVVGAKILEENQKLEVDLEEPDHEIYIEIREDNAYVFTNIIPGTGGLPVGSQGKTVVLFSGNVNGLVTAYLALKRGSLPTFIFLNPKGEKEEKEALEVFKNLSKIHTDLELRVIPFQQIQRKIEEKIPKGARWLICRRMRTKLADLVAENIDAKIILTEETLKNLSDCGLEMVKISEEKSSRPVLHPLTGFSPEKIEKIGEKLNQKGNLWVKNKICPSIIDAEKQSIQTIRKLEKTIGEEELLKSALESTKIHALGE